MIDPNKKECRKKLWLTPQLTVIARGMPEEAVLLACKYTTIITALALTTVGNCKVVGACTVCNEGHGT